MPRKYIPVTAKNTGKRLHLYLPVTLLKRLEKYVADTGASITSVIIIALDEFLRLKGY